MAIQWFPGHMTKARRQLEAIREVIDVVIEIVDARVPQSSQNPLIDEVFVRQPRLVVLNKADLAEESITTVWIEAWTEEKRRALAMDARTGKGMHAVFALCQQLLAPLYTVWRKKGMQPRAIRAVVVGIPNVGKSTWINRFVQQAATKTGNRPGITKGTQWIRVHPQLDLLDTPGLLWPKFEDDLTGLKLAATGAVRDTVFSPEDVACWLLKFLQQAHPHSLFSRYGMTITNDEQEVSCLNWLHTIGHRRGAMRKGGLVDYVESARIVLRDFQAGLLGRCSLEKPALFIQR